MMGIVFTEFFDMVEHRHGLRMSEQLLDAVAPANEGAYTAVGNYDHQDMMRYVAELARDTGRSVDMILAEFGEYLFEVFVRRYPGLIESAGSAIEFLGSVEAFIHVEVVKLYPDAELPHFEYPVREQGRLVMVYRSSRSLAPFALGLIRGCIAHFGDALEVRMTDLSEQGTRARFEITPVA